MRITNVKCINESDLFVVTYTPNVFEKLFGKKEREDTFIKRLEEKLDDTPQFFRTNGKSLNMFTKTYEALEEFLLNN